MNNWKKLKIGSFLRERPGHYAPSDKEVAGLKRLKKIDFSGEMHLGDKASKTDMIVAHPGDLVISGINVAKGAIAIYSGDAPVAATIHYSSYSFDEKQINIEFFKWFIKSPLFEQTLKEQVRGGIKTEIKPKNFLPLEISLPEVKAQTKIVSFFKKIETEMSDLQTEIASQQSLIKRLRQQILQDAIEGKLTADWRKKNPALITGENHASKLLEKIKSEKSRLIHQGKLKKEKPLPPITEAEKPFPLPEGWVWCRLGEITALITKGSSPNWQGIRYVEREEGIRFITSKNVGVFKIDLTDETFVEKSFNQVEPRSILRNGDILTNIVGASIGRTALYDLDDIANINQAVCLIRIKTELLYKTYLLQVLNSPTLTTKMHENEFAPGRANLSMGNVANFIISIPPFAEQQAIVECVGKLMAMIDELEKQAAERKNQSERLMQSVLREAFEK